MNDTVLNKEIKEILSAVNSLQGAFTSFEDKMMDGFEAMDRKMDIIYEELSGKYVALKTEKAVREDILSLHKRVSRLEEKLVL